MGAKLSSDWDLEFGGDDNVVPIRSRAARQSDTQRGVPRVVPTNEPPAFDGHTQSYAAERPLQRQPPAAQQVREVYPIADPQAEATLEFDSLTLQRQRAAALPSQPYHLRLPAIPQAPEPAKESRKTVAFDKEMKAAKANQRGAVAKESSRRPAHADLNLQLARHDDQFHQSALIVLSDLHAKTSWHSWAAIGAGIVTVAAVVVGLAI